MSIKFKIVFYNLMLFLVLFDFIYLMVWAFSIEMNPVKGILAAGIAAILMPWARKSKNNSGRKVIIRSLGYDFYLKLKKQRISKKTIIKE